MMSMFFLLIALVPIVFLADGFIEREVQVSYGSYRRDDEPGWYWAAMGLYAALLAYLIYAAINVALT